LRGEAEWVGDRETDAAVADVQREGAGMGHGVSVRRRKIERDACGWEVVNRMRKMRCLACDC
jgi:hypothetical protein